MSANRTFVRRIRSALELADDSAHAAGVLWYPQAGQLCEEFAARSGRSLEHVAVAMAHLSPQCPWSLNVKATRRLFVGDGEREPGILHASFARAVDSLELENPFDSFSVRANKTRNFARNLLGDTDAVTVDVWIARVVGIDNEVTVFQRPRLYREIADSYRTAARSSEYTPRELQAITWIGARGRAA